MRLYSTTTSPFARKIRVLIHELGLGDRVQLEQLVTTVLAPNADLAAVHPLIKIPTLLTDDGVTLYDSRVIAEYLQSQVANPLLLPTGPERFLVLRTQALADGILDAAIAVFYENRFRPEAQRSPEMMAAQTDKVERALAELARTQETWARTADTFDLGQIAVACTLAWLEFRAPLVSVRERFAPLYTWLDGVSARASMASTAPSVP